jgi:hypothetical protein
MRGAIKHIVILLLAAALVLLFLIPAVRRMEPHHDVPPPVVHDTTPAVPPPTAAERPQVIDESEGPSAEWRPVVSWEGTGLKTTQRFTIIVNTWRIVWETEVMESLGAGAFQMQVFENGTLKSVVADTSKTDRGVTDLGTYTRRGVTFLEGSGTFTLSISTLQKWKVKVEEKG